MLYPTLECCPVFLFSVFCVLVALSLSLSFFCFFYFCLAAAQMAVAVDAEFKGRITCLHSYPFPLLPLSPTALHDRS